MNPADFLQNICICSLSTGQNYIVPERKVIESQNLVVTCRRAKFIKNILLRIQAKKNTKFLEIF